MRFAKPLVPARLLRRYKRFLADVVLEEREVQVHCPNPGAMTGLATPDSEVWLAPTTTKIPWRWTLTRVGDHLVGIDTSKPNALVAEALATGTLPELAGYANIKPEVRYSTNSRIDLLLTDPDRPPCYVEVKNVHLLRTGTTAEFPDCVTLRGAKHLGDLAAEVARGNRAVMVYLVQRGDCAEFRLAADIDPGYARAFDTDRRAGVEMLCYDCRVAVDGIVINRPLPIV
jgi:sugar fermentation stimulation protein A